MKKSTFSRVLTSVGKYKIRLSLSVYFALLQVASSLLIPIFVGNAIDSISLSDGVDFKTLGEQISYVVICIVVSALSQWILSVCNNAVAYNCVRDLRKSVFDKNA